MAKLSSFLKKNNDTGFGNNADDYGGRFVNKDGSFNIKRVGVPFWEKFSMYHSMISMPTWQFFSIIVLSFVLMNLLFTVCFWLIGVPQFTGVLVDNEWLKFRELFFFSTETFSTVGYGRVNPVGGMANAFAAADALSGSLFFALVTGLMYGRFSKPKAYLSFSRKALITPYQGITGLMFRIVSNKNKILLTEVEIKVNVSMLVEENGIKSYQFFNLPLERNKLDNLALNLTVVHPIDENSPIKDMNIEEMKNVDLEIYVLIKAYEDGYANNVLQRTSYTYDEIIFEAKFDKMYNEASDGGTTILHLDKLNSFKMLK